MSRVVDPWREDSSVVGLPLGPRTGQKQLSLQDLRQGLSQCRAASSASPCVNPEVLVESNVLAEIYDVAIAQVPKFPAGTAAASRLIPGCVSMPPSALG